jgi:LCP family protein required for cell wall assembly
VLSLPPEVETFILLGSDYNAPYVGRTDTIILAFLNSQSGNMSLVSIPRDLYVYLPGKGMQRINIAYGLGGADLMFQTLEYNLGIRPQHWALVHLDDFVHFVDEIGGVEVHVSNPIPLGEGSFPRGIYKISGELAMYYVRIRTGSSDFERVRRQQEVILSILKEVLNQKMIPRLQEWYERYSQTIETDLTLADLTPLVPLALRLREGQGLHQYQISLGEVVNWQEPQTGALVLIPQRDKITLLLQQAIDALALPVATPADLETYLAQLTASPTPTPAPTFTPELSPENPDASTITETPTPEMIETPTPAP